MVYPSPSTINASKGIGEVLNYTNVVTNNGFANLILIAIYSIVLIAFYKSKDDFKGAFAVAGFSTFVVSLFFWIGGFVSGTSLTIVISLTLLGILVLWLDNN
jgi:hypothetical protein